MWVLLGILGLLGLMLSGSVCIKVCYQKNGAAVVKVGYAGISVAVYDSDKKVEQKSGGKRRQKQSVRKRAKAHTEQETEDKTRLPIQTIYNLVLDLIGAVIKPSGKLIKHVRFVAVRVRVIVASDDCAKTAQDYGKLSAAIYGGVSFLRSVCHVKLKKLFVGFDFAKTTPEIDFSFKVKLRLCFVLWAGLCMIGRFVCNIIKKRRFYFGTTSPAQQVSAGQ